MNLIADLDQFVVLVLDHAHGLCRLLEDVILALALLLQTAGARPQHLQLALQVLDPVNHNTLIIQTHAGDDSQYLSSR